MSERGSRRGRRLGMGVSAALFVIAAFGTIRSAPHAALSQPVPNIRLTVASPATSSVPSHTAGGSAFVAGDRIRLSVYEKLALEDDKWSERRRQGRPDESYALRTEMSGENVIQTDETISLPILGSIRVVGLNTAGLEDEIRARFTEVLGRNAKVSVTLTERPPIAVIGPVKQPGTYKFTPGMTALHAIALAGGFGSKSENWGSLEIARDAAKATTASRKLAKSLAALFVLHAEQDGKVAAPPGALVDLLGRELASKTLDEAKQRRERLTAAIRERRLSLVSAISTAEQALVIARERTEVLNQGLSSRQKRADALRDLYSKGGLSRTVMDQAEGELADMKDRALTNVAKVSESEMSLSNAKQELARFDYDNVATQDREITEEERTILDCQEQINISQASQNAYDAQLGTPDLQSANQVEFELVRKSPSGVISMSIQPTTQLEPGDLVRATTTKHLLVSR